MPRRAVTRKRTTEPDIRYQSEMVAKMIAVVMERGKKSLATNLVYSAMEQAAAKANQEPLELFEGVMRNVSPMIEVRPKRVGGATYQVPIEVRGSRKTALGMRWILQGARTRKGQSFDRRLAEEFLDALNGQGFAMKKKEDTHRMAEANRAFAHYARF
jgi:small subunit ribosomal protein S7